MDKSITQSDIANLQLKLKESHLTELQRKAKAFDFIASDCNVVHIDGGGFNGSVWRNGENEYAEPMTLAEWAEAEQEREPPEPDLMGSSESERNEMAARAYKEGGR